MVVTTRSRSISQKKEKKEKKEEEQSITARDKGIKSKETQKKRKFFFSKKRKTGSKINSTISKRKKSKRRAEVSDSRSRSKKKWLEPKKKSSKKEKKTRLSINGGTKKPFDPRAETPSPPPRIIKTVDEIFEESKYNIISELEESNREFQYNEELQNDLMLNEVVGCNLITSKKDNYYYKFTTSNKILPDNIEGIDYKSYEKCCNCICLLYYTLYPDRSDCFDGFLEYVSSIVKTINNVKKYLDDYLVRIYLDPSVYNYIKNLKEKNENVSENICNQLVHQMFASENVEIYTFLCKNESLDYELDVSKTRAYRLLVLKDPTANVKVVREADGTVTRMDCFNIRKFEKSNKLFYLPSLPNISISPNWNLEDYFYKPDDIPHMYSNWLNNNMYTFKKDYKKWPAFNLLCGMFATKILFKKEYFDSCVKKVKQNLGAKFYNFAFDEILLLHLFKNILYYPITEPPKIENKYIYENSSGVKFNMHTPDPTKFNDIVFSELNKNIKIYKARVEKSSSFSVDFNNDNEITINLDEQETEKIIQRHKNFLEDMVKNKYRIQNLDSLFLYEILQNIDQNINFDQYFKGFDEPIDIHVSYDYLKKIFINIEILKSREGISINFFPLNELLNKPFSGSIEDLNS